MDLFTYLMAKKGHNTHRDLFSYLLGKNAGGSGTYTTFSGTSLNISNTLQAKIKNIAFEGNTSQDGTPTPDTPIPIKVVTGGQSIKIHNKNLFDMNWLVKGYISDSIVDNRTNRTRTDAILFKAGTYTFHFIYTSSKWVKCVEYANPTTTSGTFLFNIESSNYTKTITLENDTWLRFGIDDNLTNVLANATIQTEKGTTATPYEPYYTPQTYPLSLGNIELAGINDYKDYIFKNEVGSPYYNADLDLNGWYLYKIIDKLTLNGSETYIYQSNYARFLYAHNISNLSIGDVNKSLCNYFIYGTQNNNFYINNTYLYFYASNFTSADNFKNFVQEKYENGNALTVYIPLATPTNTKITDEALIQQLENINNNARSYKDTTIIECTSASTDNETISFSGDIKVTSVGLGNSLNSNLLSQNINDIQSEEETNIDSIQEEPNIDDVNEIEVQNDEPIEEEVS